MKELIKWKLQTETKLYYKSHSPLKTNILKQQRFRINTVTAVQYGAAANILQELNLNIVSHFTLLEVHHKGICDDFEEE